MLAHHRRPARTGRTGSAGLVHLITDFGVKLTRRGFSALLWPADRECMAGEDATSLLARAEPPAFEDPPAPSTQRPDLTHRQAGALRATGTRTQWSAVHLSEQRGWRFHHPDNCRPPRR